MAKRKEQLCPACHALLDKYNRTRVAVNGEKVLLCLDCAEAARKGKEAFRRRIETMKNVNELLKLMKSEQDKEEEEPPDDFERQIYAMLEDIRKAEEFFKQIR